ncbi:MAG: CHAD domain-containing protein [Sphingobium sp.]
MVKDSFYLSADQFADLVDSRVGALTLLVTWEEGRPAFTIRDSFGHGLRCSQRLLLEISDGVELLTASGGRLRQGTSSGERFAAQFADGPVKDALADLSPLRALLPVASGTARLGRLTLLDDEGKTRARAALWELTPGKGNAVVLVRVEGVRGYDKALDDLIDHIRDCGGTSLAAGNLYRMIDPGLLAYRSRPAVEVGRDETAFDAATDLIGGYLPVVRANEDGIISDLDTEFLHDYRVAMRKIRSVLSLFKGVYVPDQTADLKARFSALMAPTGALRDLDVYLLDQQAFFDLVPDSMHEGLASMFALLEARRVQVHAALAAHLRGDAYKAEMKALTKLFRKRNKLLPGPNASRASYDLACELIQKRYRKIGRIAAGLTSKTPDTEVHALRIECKKLRYLLEFFGPVFPKETLLAVLKPLRKLQDSLGLFNDHAVQQARLMTFSDTLGDAPRKLEIVQSIGALIVVLHQRQAAEREKILSSFAAFNSHRMQRAFRRLLDAGKES